MPFRRGNAENYTLDKARDARPRGRSVGVRALDRALYVAFAAAVTLVAARAFYGYMLVQTNGEWSAPLDDVFIHFDYARATAQGHPFEWCVGNGYSSGNTSLLYPFVLALGYSLGFTHQSLMVWAAIVACCSVLCVLLVAPRLFRNFSAATKYLAPLALLCVGALDWTLFSGMEVAFFLAVWAGALRAMMRLCGNIEDAPASERVPHRTEASHEARRPCEAAAVGQRDDGAARALTAVANTAVAKIVRFFARWELGLWGVLLVTTRPEAAATMAVLGGCVAMAAARKRGVWSAAGELVRAGAPPLLALVVQSVANRMLTGEWSANGSIVKLSLFNPYMPPRDKFDEYRFLLEYVLRRNVEHHFTSLPLWGWAVPILAAVPLVARKTRRDAVVLWLSALTWLGLVAMNGQVRWQNERYTMPAVAWVLLLAAMGLAVLASPWRTARDAPRAGTRRRGSAPEPTARPWQMASGAAQWLRNASVGQMASGAAQWLRNASVGQMVRAAIAAALIAAFWHFQAPCMRDQIWFFGRACRNIRDQHITTGRLLAEMTPKPNRIMLGDAGALAYASEIPGLDLIGLGGYHDLPFARAGIHGLGATLELMERMPRKEWPEVMAIYPSWWGDLPGWFGTRLFEVPVYGNVICGGAEKVVYRADWSALGHGAQPGRLAWNDRIVDELDVADLISEREHAYQFPHPAAGFVDARVLTDSTKPKTGARANVEVFDAGRRIPHGRTEHFRMHQAPDLPSRLIVRTAVEHRGTVEVRVDGQHAADVDLQPADGWQELSVALPGTGRAAVDLELTVRDGPDWVDHHVWLVQAVVQAAR